ncbi:dipeptide/oligopeptide/nickel ABC transporter ATP-binding protein [Ensifer sp. 1H6]|uniref:ABC transporter ATP-binding protein n=1 Tax=Ensifer sp. 1H6 TaxID=1911585 RepID=UPI0018E9CB80|nr:dipeptide/oligopeptide/nickel ABC transporter ATP-binding protein [Ensifer sp. 1H6]
METIAGHATWSRTMDEPLLQIRDLVVRYRRMGLFAAPPSPAVNAISLDLPTGSTLGLVGESGSGKSSLLRAILRLVPVESGTIRLEGEDWLALPEQVLRERRRAIGVVAQNPFLSLSPRLTIAEILGEPMTAQADVPLKELRDRAAEMLERCGLPATFLTRRARELSGGQAQRVAIARALVLHPKLLILDEPTSALDISVQAQILNLLADLKQEFGLSMLFVTHNLKVVRHVSDTLVVMRFGRVVEAGSTEQVTLAPADDYTRQLMGYGGHRP